MANENRAGKLAEEMAAISATIDKPILLCTYTTASAAAIAALAGAGIPCYTSMPSCARSIRALVDYGAFRQRLAARSAPLQTASPAREAVATALAKAGPVLTEVAS